MDDLKRKQAVLLLFVLAALLLGSFAVRQLLSVERPQGYEYKILAEQLMAEAKEAFEEIRGVSVRNVTLEVVNESWVIENWGVPYINPAETEITENIYKALFMIPQEANLTEVQLQWTGMFHAAKWRGTIYVVEEKFDLTEDTKAISTFVHELTHILQEGFPSATRTTFDGSEALSALSEGDATLMADTYRNGGTVPPPAEVTMPSSSTLPQSINKLNRFVYRYGVEFVKAVYNHNGGGWDAVNKAYENPPSTTEQILHPEKYFAGEEAQTVELPHLNNDWSLKKTDTLGEYFVRVMMENWIPVHDAEQAAEGWGGDSLEYYENGGEFLFAWKIVWDSADDAHEFYVAFQEMMYETGAEKHNCSYWLANGRYISIQWSENSTLIVSSANENDVQQIGG